jgi:hypothetical protein
MKKMIQILMILFTIALAGCKTTIEIEIPDVDSISISATDDAVYADGEDYTRISVIPYDYNDYALDEDDYLIDYKISPSIGVNIDNYGRFTATTAGTYSVQVKIDGIWSNSITIKAARGLKIVNAATTSIHLITWEPTGNNRYWFTPSTEYSKFYPYDNNQVPTLKSGTSCQQEVIAGTSYLYFVLTDKSDFGYYRTASKISVGSSYGAADGRTFEFTNLTTGVKTDENQNDLPVPVIREIKIFKGVRSVVREIPLIKITKEEMNK